MHLFSHHILTNEKLGHAMCVFCAKCAFKRGAPVLNIIIFEQ